MMSAGDIIDAPLDWVAAGGNYPDTVLSSRVRLARNLRKWPFPWRSGEEGLRSVAEIIRGLVATATELSETRTLDVNELDASARQALLERRIISPDFTGGGPGREVVLDDRGVVSLMVNEEDHIRIQVILGGLQLQEALGRACEVDKTLEPLEYAFNSEYGYMTACPTNTGTGMRASVMIHIPALDVMRQTGRIIRECNRVGLTFRGMYGEGSESAGSLFQVSNQVALGPTEDELVEKVSGVASRLAGQETKARKTLLEKKGIELEDRAWRAWGIIHNARSVSSRELLELLSMIRVGSALEILPPFSPETWNRLLLFSQPAHVRVTADEDDDKERGIDVLRAQVIRRLLEQN